MPVVLKKIFLKLHETKGLRNGYSLYLEQIESN